VKGVVTDRGHAERIVIMNGAFLRERKQAIGDAPQKVASNGFM
jgi:glycine/D-amino acid oxidase-like deaminating enzyme